MDNCTLITGAASGFGRAIAHKLAPAHRLLLADVDGEKLEAVCRECASTAKPLAWVRDLSRLDGLGDELAALLAAQGATVSHFVHSAGIFGFQSVRAHDMAFVNRTFNINLFSAMEIIRPLTRKAVNREALRSVTFISSINARLGAKGHYVYAGSKAALNAMMLSLAVELAPRVRVNAVLPGTVSTGMNTALFADPDFVASTAATHPLGLGRPEDIADAVEYLSSDRARWITGQELAVDGGRLARK